MVPTKRGSTKTIVDDPFSVAVTAEGGDNDAVRKLKVPEPHHKDRSAWPSLDRASAPETSQHSVRIHCGKDKPASAFAAVRYRDYWFWVENGDFITKRAPTVVMFIFTLSETGNTEKLPLVTIPAQ